MIFKAWNFRASGGLALLLGVGATLCPRANAELIYGVSDQLNQLVSFDSATPGTLKSAIALTGLATGEQIRGIDWVNGTLYGLGDENHLYTINTGTGACSLVGTSFSPVLNGIDFGLTLGPSQLLYVSSDLGQSLTLNPLTGAASVLPNITGASIDSLAYNFANGSFIGISSANHDLYSVNPTTGATSLIGSTGINFLDGVGLSVSPVTDIAYFSGTVGGQTELFLINPSTGALTTVGDIGVLGELTSGLNSIAPTGISPVPEPGTLAFLAAGGGFALMLARRKK